MSVSIIDYLMPSTIPNGRSASEPVNGIGARNSLAAVSGMQPQMSEDLRMLILAVMQTGDAVMIASSQGVIQFVNPAFERDSGYSANEAVGRSTNLLKSGEHPPRVFPAALEDHPCRRGFPRRFHQPAQERRDLLR